MYLFPWTEGAQSGAGPLLSWFTFEIDTQSLLNLRGRGPHPDPTSWERAAKKYTDRSSLLQAGIVQLDSPIASDNKDEDAAE